MTNEHPRISKEFLSFSIQELTVVPTRSIKAPNLKVTGKPHEAMRKLRVGQVDQSYSNFTLYSYYPITYLNFQNIVYFIIYYDYKHYTNL